jgi:SAM-dependent methyltransferase
MVVTVRQRLGAQNQKPTGVLGWAAAGLMLVEGPSGCRHQAVAELLDLQPSDMLLDIACGSGLFLRRRATHVQRVAGLDHSSVQISLARRLLRQRIDAGTAEVMEGDAAALPWPDNEFSAVTCNCLYCVAEAGRAVAEMHRVLRPGGRLVLATDFHADPAAARQQEREWGWRAWTEPELRTLLEKAGFTEIRLSHDADTTFATAVKPQWPPGTPSPPQPQAEDIRRPHRPPSARLSRRRRQARGPGPQARPSSQAS